MLAYHPITGKEIRVIQTDASIWKEQKTLAFTNTPSVYDTIYTGFLTDGSSPDYLLVLGDIPNPMPKSKLFIFSKAIPNKLSSDFLYLEEFNDMYPHLGSWDKTLEHAVILVAELLRYRYVQGITHTKPNIPVKTDKPMRLVWITQYYKPENTRRRKEIDKCLSINVKSPLIDRVILLNEKMFEDINGPKIDQRVIGQRITYANVMEAILEMPDDVLVVFANADICIDDSTWKSLWSVNLENVFLAILRYDVPASGRVEEATMFGPRADSQDTWVVRAIDVKARGTSIIAPLDFKFGQMGCDNVVALEMLRQKFVVVNPSYSLRTWHFHSSDIRGYSKSDVLYKPVFHYIHPSGFHDIQPIMNLEIIKSPSLIRPVRGSAAADWVKKINSKADGAKWSLESTNPSSSVSPAILHLKNCFQTSGGLVFDNTKMYIGKGQEAQKIWGKAEIHGMTPTIRVGFGLIAPWPVNMKDREVYLVKFLSKILQLRAASGRLDGEFMCPPNKSFVDALHIFNWGVGKMPIIQHEHDMQVWCSEAYAFPVNEIDIPSREDMAALRAAVSWKEKPDTFQGRLRIVLVQDDTILTHERICELEDVLERAWDVRVVYSGTDQTSAERMVDVMSGAWGVIGVGGIVCYGWNWLLPKGARVFEILDKASEDGINISAACELEHRIVQNSAKHIFEAVWEEEKAWTAAPTEFTNIPTIWMPRHDLEGYFSHPGDSFREMVKLWSKKGYVHMREHAAATMVWWEDVGANGVLLYDRPNHEWRLASPLLEKSWKFALFGNPKPPAGSSAWTFWPRRPELVEEIAALPRKGWAERTAGPVFYGKVENRVQEKRRPLNWESACEQWVLVKGETPYPFTQRIYLENLASSRFGLCLAGYGLKCHREVECFAMGCVPLVAPEVDMDSYNSPPIEGVHYIRVGSPEAARLASQMSQDAWEKMSAAGVEWWKTQASADGSFEITKKIIEAASANASTT